MKYFKVWTLALFQLAGVGMISLGYVNAALGAHTLEEAFQEGRVSGNFRMHYNERHYESSPDATAFALGGALRAETGYLGGFKVGVGFYTAQDLGINDDDPAKVDGRMGSELEVLGEAYLNYSAWNSSFTLGRQKFNTPFANPIDVFIVPFTFEGLSIKNHSIPNLALELDYITRIKSPGSEEFVDVGTWSTNRYGVTSTETAGTLMLGGTYKRDGITIRAWLDEFADLFKSGYLQADYAFAPMGSMKPFAAAQVIVQSETGDALLGEVDSTVFGLKAGLQVDKAEVSLGYTNIKENEDSFNNGAFLAPYNFSTSPLFTNSMLKNMENNDAGEGVKLALLYHFSSVKMKLSYAHLDFAVIPDLDAVDFDVTYFMDQITKGLSLRYRVEIVKSDSDAVQQSDHRFQLQYIF